MATSFVRFRMKGTHVISVTSHAFGRSVLRRPTADDYIAGFNGSGQ